jgi:hypothetical protein
LVLDLVSVTDLGRIESRLSDSGGGGARLEVPGHGDTGGALEIAACRGDGTWQLGSRAASRIIGTFRRIRRLLRQESRLVAHCPDYWERKKEIVPGVRAWWAIED